MNPNTERVQGCTRALGETNRVFTEESATSLRDTGDFLFFLTSAPSACAGQQPQPIQTRGRHRIRLCLISLHGKVQGKVAFWMDLLPGSASKSHFSVKVGVTRLKCRRGTAKRPPSEQTVRGRRQFRSIVVWEEKCTTQAVLPCNSS